MTDAFTFASAHAESDPLVFSLIAGTFGVVLIVLGLRTWRGEEFGYVEEHQRAHGPMTLPNIFGGVRLYQTPIGSLHTGVPAGIGFTAMSTAEFLRVLLAESSDWWLMYAASSIAIPCIAASFVYTTAYFWTGVPDFMRPPAQRGWKMTKHGYELVRPEAVPPHERR